MDNYDTTQDERLLAMLTYLLTFIAPIIAPLIIYLIKKDQSRFIAFHAIQNLLMQAAMAALGIVVGILAGILGAMGPLALLVIPLALLPFLAGIAVLVFTIIGAIKSFGGEWYQASLVGPYARQQADM